MPNWIEGCMKIRGSQKNVHTFLTNAFEYVNGKWVDGKYVVEKDETAFSEEVYDDYCSEISVRDGSHLIGSRRAFINGSAYAYIEDISSDKEISEALELKQAWGWFDEEFYKSLSDKYNIDIRLIGWEMGMEYKGELEVLRGHDPTYKETKYDDWRWEAECPLLGG